MNCVCMCDVPDLNVRNVRISQFVNLRGYSKNGQKSEKKKHTGKIQFFTHAMYCTYSIDTRRRGIVRHEFTSITGKLTSSSSSCEKVVP